MHEIKQRFRMTVIAGASLLVLVAAAADHIGLAGEGNGFGTGQTVALLAAVAILCVAVADSKVFWTPRIVLACSTAYFALVIIDVAMSYSAAASPQKANLALRWIYVPDEEIGYRLAPGARLGWLLR